ncbi:uncharacterized protein N0V89_008405 [Didymosphaeria variabile]|uniref:DUF7704 domain-containing protein n=1 Tax=Didymosphaeria variabile TaxID=1932322 RepID=A0A9W8XHI1_9PLEO|nr:uncharacterized protein N0V89_008405 [Didymosphaeria variabile]KAJ4349787.1 hypothetical protein N0V89_008405 [Didymosphaeria variabile]
MALGTVLPFWPALLFTYLEPISLILGWNAAWNSPSDFITKQLPTPTLVPVPDAALVLSYTTGNIFILLALLAVLCTAITRDARVAKYYLLFVAAGDLGHIFSSYKVMGPEVFWNFNQYNDMMWGNIGASAFLHVNRLATVLGVFGRIRGL